MEKEEFLLLSENLKNNIIENARRYISAFMDTYSLTIEDVSYMLDINTNMLSEFISCTSDEGCNDFLFITKLYLLSRGDISFEKACPIDETLGNKIYQYSDENSAKRYEDKIYELLDLLGVNNYSDIIDVIDKIKDIKSFIKLPIV